MDRGPDIQRRSFDIRASSRSAGRIRAASSAAGRAAHAPRGAAEREVGHGGEARLVLAQREQEVGGAVGRRQLAVHLHAPAVGPAPAGPDQQRARLSHQPDAEGAALEHEPGAGVQLARLVADEVAEQAERGRAPARRPSARRGRTTSAPRFAYSDGIAHACTTRTAATGNDSGSSAMQRGRRQQPRHRVTERAQRPAALAPAQPRVVEPWPPEDGRRLGKDAHPPAIGRRRMTSSASAGSSRTCSACPSPVLTTA